MYTLVKSKDEVTKFNEIWSDFCEESDILFLNYNPYTHRYLLLNDEKVPIGTIEIGEYTHTQSNVEKMFSFSHVEEIKALHNKQIYEVSKLAINQQFRGNGFFKKSIVLLALYAEKKKVDWYIGMVNPRLYKYARTMGFSIFSIGKSISLSNKIEAIPFLLDAKQGIEHLLSFSDLRILFEISKNANEL